MAETQKMDQVASPQLPLPSHPVLSGKGSQLADPEPIPTGLLSPGINIELHSDSEDARPATAAHSSPPPAEQQFQSPIRQHRRTPSAHRLVKETLNARSEYTSDEQDGRSHHRINQYVIKEEIGRGSYGAVHLATDQFGNEYAVKEFSKARLRKRAQSNILRLGPRGPGPGPGRLGLRAGMGLRGHTSARLNDHEASEAKDALFLIREEIAIMKKLNHPNLVQLIEVLDDPEEDSLYMVLEMCKKGVIMKVGLDEPADPYPVESCRCWFRDLILGIEYLHTQGVVHRDIKPDNLLLTDDDVLKVVDFGVSEIFEKSEQMRTAKSAGSPAFLPPELCIARHGDVSGKAADIWSMGVSLYCLRYGKIPFERSGVLEMYEAIKTETVKLSPDDEEDFVDLMSKLLEKDPANRITMCELREHPWVTKKGQDPLLSAEENSTEQVDPPNALELNHAFTRKMSHLLCVMKAISKFKGLLAPKESPRITSEDEAPRQSESSEGDTSQADEKNSVADYATQVLLERERFFKSNRSRDPTGERGHAHDPSSADPLFLGIGTGGQDDFVSEEQPPAGIVSDSPTAVDFDVYDRAFEAEVEKIKRSSSRRGGARRGAGGMYLTKQLGEKQKYQTDDSVTWVGGSSNNTPRASTPQVGGPKFADVVSQTMEVKDTKDSSNEEA